MAPPSKKQKWRQLDLSATEQYIDDTVLHERVEQLEASGSLFQIDTSGCAPAANLTQRARRLLQQQLLAAGGEGAVLRTAEQPKTLRVEPKKPLLQVISVQHKKQLRRFIVRQQQKEKRSSAQAQKQRHSAQAGACSSLTHLHRTSISCSNAGGGGTAGQLEDLWPAEDGSSAARRTSPPPQQEGETREEDRKQRRRSEAAAAAGSRCDGEAALLHERQLEEPAAAGSASLGSGQQQRQKRRKGGRSTNQQEKAAAEPAAAAAVRTAATTEEEGGVVTGGDAAAEAKEGKGTAAQGGAAEANTAGGGRGRGRGRAAADLPKKLTARALRSFDKLRPYIPVVRLPGDSESYNPSADASACGLLAAAVRTLEEQRETQKLQRCSGRSSVTQQAQQQQDREKLELLLLANVQQREIDQRGARRFLRCPVESEAAPQTEKPQREEAQQAGEKQQQQQQGCSRMQRVDQVLGTVLPPEEVMLLTDTQKQRLLLDLVYKGKVSSPVCEEEGSREQSPAANGLHQQLRATETQQQQQGKAHDAKLWSSRTSAAAATGHEEAASDEEDDAAGDCASLSRAKQREKKTRAERNRRLRFLQQQRRHAAKVAARSWRAAVDRVDMAVQQLDAEAEELARRQKEREEKLRAKILAAKQGQVRLKIGRNRLVEAPPAVQLPGDVTGSLRTAKPAAGTSGALCEYVASLRRRGLLELPFTGGATGAALRHAQRQRSRRLASRKTRKRKD